MTIKGIKLSASSASDFQSSVANWPLDSPEVNEAKLFVVFASPTIPLQMAQSKLCELFPAAAVIGCSTAGEFTDAGEMAGSIAILALCGDMRVSAGFGPGLRKDVEKSVREACETLHSPGENNEYSYHTALMFADGLAFVGEEAALLAAIHLGPNVAIAGASAGDDFLLQKTIVGVGSNVEEDAAGIVLVSTREPVGIGVAHGHKPLGVEGTVTRAEGNIVHEIDNRPAWEVYKEATWPHAQQNGYGAVDFENPTEFVGYMARYEAGLQIEDGYKVRAALTKNPDDSLNFVCQMPVATKIAFMASTPDDQIDSATRAARMALKGLGTSPAAAVLVFECGCRKIILQNEFEKAVFAVASQFPNAPVVGAETYGEIALHSGSLSAYHNSTTVVVAFGAKP